MRAGVTHFRHESLFTSNTPKKAHISHFKSFQSKEHIKTPVSLLAIIVSTQMMKAKGEFNLYKENKEHEAK